MGCCTSNPQAANSKEKVRSSIQLIDRNSKNSSQTSPFSTRGANVSADSVSPHVWFVVKTRREDKTKIFINLFYHENVKEMYPIELSKSWDKKGEVCLVYGAVVSRATYMDAERDTKFCNSVCTDAITFLNNKYKDSMSLEFTKPKIVKGFMGALIENIDLPDEYRLVKKLKDPAQAAAVVGDVNSSEVQNGDESKEQASGATPSGATSPVVVSAETINPILKDTPDLSEAYIIPNQTLPLVTRTWARSKRRDNKVLKTYYFVLDRGTLSMFKDSREEPPYGHGMKGSLFLSSFRASKSTESNEDCVVVLTFENSNNQEPVVEQVTTTTTASDQPFTPRNVSSDNVTSVDTSRNSLFDGIRPVVILFVDQKSRDKWLVAFRQHISWAVLHPEDDKTKSSESKSRLSWIPSPFGKK